MEFLAWHGVVVFESRKRLKLALSADLQAHDRRAEAAKRGG
jgi:hypothetical protein